jgi:hypothetical protein
MYCNVHGFVLIFAQSNSDTMKTTNPFTMKTMFYSGMLAFTLLLSASAVELAVRSTARVIHRHSLKVIDLPELPVAATKLPTP